MSDNIKRGLRSWLQIQPSSPYSGIHMEKRPHRFDRLREMNPKEWEFWMYRCCTDPDSGKKYGWGRVLDWIGVKWEDKYVDWEKRQISMTDYLEGLKEKENE